MISRRYFLSCTAGAVYNPSSAITTAGDAKLVSIGRRFLQVAQQMDVMLKQPNSADPGAVRFNQKLGELEELDAEIQQTRATTLRGIRVKAEIANWSREGDLKPKDFCLDERMAWAIVSDLMKMQSF